MLPGLTFLQLPFGYRPPDDLETMSVNGELFPYTPRVYAP
jgi:hypothetical protein